MVISNMNADGTPFIPEGVTLSEPAMPDGKIRSYNEFIRHFYPVQPKTGDEVMGEFFEKLDLTKTCDLSLEKGDKEMIQVLKPLTVEQISTRLRDVHRDVQEKIHDQWDWMDADFYVEALLAHISRKDEILREFPKFPATCSHDAEPDYCPCCRYEWEKELSEWRERIDQELSR